MNWIDQTIVGELQVGELIALVAVALFVLVVLLIWGDLR